MKGKKGNFFPNLKINLKYDLNLMLGRELGRKVYEDIEGFKNKHHLLQNIDFIKLMSEEEEFSLNLINIVKKSYFQPI